MSFREQAYLLTGQRRGRVWLMHRRHHASGTASSVEIDWHQVLEREERYSDVLGFLHTHPPRAGIAPSLRDIRTMQAWSSAFGKPLLCVIECYGRTGSTLFRDEDDVGRPLPVTEHFPRGIIVVMADIDTEGRSDDDESA